MIKAVIFDNNGVLTTCDNDTTVPAFAKYFGIDTEYLRPIFHKVVEPADRGEITTEEFFHRLCGAVGRECKPEEIWPFFLRCYQPKPEMQIYLEVLSKSAEIALLTNFVDVFDKLNQDVWHYERFFKPENMFVSSKSHLAKPDKNIYLYALRKLGIDASEAVFVDDRESNLVPARELGMQTVLFESPQQCQNELKLILEKENG